MFAFALLCAGCNDGNKIAEENDSKIIDLPPGEKLVNFAGSRYYNYVIHRKMHAGENPEEYTIDSISTADDSYKKKAYVVREH